MNSEGEKIPPDEPDPRLSDVASELAGEQNDQERRSGQPAVRISCTVE